MIQDIVNKNKKLKTTKASVLVGNGKFEIQDLPLSELKPDHCRIKILSAGVCSSDIPRAFDNGAYFYPLVMGHELAGEITCCGHNVSNFLPGDRVAVFPLLPCWNCSSCKNNMFLRCLSYDYYGSRRHGGYSKYLDVNSWNLMPIPNNINIDDAAFLEPLAVTFHALDRMGLLSNDNLNVKKNLAIFGAGFLGLLALKIIRLYKLNLAVTVFDKNHYKLNLAKKEGANIVHLKGNETDKEMINEKQGLFSFVLEATGVPIMFSNSLKILQSGGVVVWMGNISDDLHLLKKDVSNILRKEITIKGTWNSTYYPKKSSDWKRALQLIVDGLKPSSLVTHRSKLCDVSEILEKLYSHKIKKEKHDILKILIKPN